MILLGYVIKTWWCFIKTAVSKNNAEFQESVWHSGTMPFIDER